MAFVAKGMLVFVTLVCLASIGGAMLFAGWCLVPLHWLASRRSGPYATGGWAFLAGLSVFEVAWMVMWIATEQTGTSLVFGTIAGLGTIALFLYHAADRAAGATLAR